MHGGQLRVASVFAISALVACSAGKPNSGFATDPPAGSDGGTAIGPDPQNGGPTVGSNDGGAPATAVCAPSVGNYEVPMNGCDDDADGKIDNVPVCDHGVALTGSADDFAKALGLCQKATGAADPKWGVVSAAYTQGYNQTAAPAAGQHGIMGKFGNVVKPREGEMLGALSSGWAREFDESSGTSAPFKGGTAMTSSGAVPPGFPKASGTCPIDTKVKDVAAIKLQLKVPKNAKGVAFDFNFHSGEWPEFVCTKFNDAFIAYLTSSALPGGKPDNISFDAMGNTVSVNNGFFDRCTPNTKTACDGISFNPGTITAACAGGEAELGGTGFEDKGIYCGMNLISGSGPTTTGGGATGWLTSKAPVTPGELITLEFMIWDTGDTAFDSSVLIDHLTWEPTATVTGTGRPPQ
jgi:hypothetical protein